MNNDGIREDVPSGERGAKPIFASNARFVRGQPRSTPQERRRAWVYLQLLSVGYPFVAALIAFVGLTFSLCSGLSVLIPSEDEPDPGVWERRFALGIGLWSLLTSWAIAFCVLRAGSLLSDLKRRRF